MNNTNTETLKRMVEAYSRSPNAKVAKVAECILNAKGRFCRITMLPQPSDSEKRNGKVRVFHTNVNANILHYQKVHGLGSGRLTETGRKIVETKFSRGMLSVLESVHGKMGRFEVQPRTVDLTKVDSVRYGGHTYKFA